MNGGNHVCALLFGLTFAFACPFAAAQQAPVNYGVIIPLSGSAANSGESCRNGINLAVEDLGPELRSRIRPIFEDDGNQAVNAVSAYKKLRMERQIDVALSFFSNTSKALAPIAEADKIPLIAIASDPDVVKGKTFVFNLWVSPEGQGEALVREARRRNYKRIAVVSATQSALMVFKSVFEQKSQGNPEIVMDKEFLPDIRDFRSVILQIKSQPKLDAVYVNLYFGQTGLFAKQARELGVRLPFFGIETFEDPAEVSSSGGALVGQWYAQADEPTGEFLSRYLARFPGASSYTAANCYDSIMLLSRSLSQGFPPGKFNEFLDNLKDFNGALGTYSSTGDKRFSLPAAIKLVTKDGFEKVSE